MSVVLTDHGEVQFGQYAVGLATPPASFYVAVCLNMPDPSVDGTSLSQVEVAGSAGYARQPIPSGGTGWASSGSGATNTVALTFGPATADWGVVRVWALCDALTGGNVLLAADLPESFRVLPDVELVLAAGALTIGAKSPTETIVT